MSTKTKETVAKAAPHYKPSGEELNDAIALVLKQETSTKPTTKSVLISIQTENPTWKLPERRVSKFIKKQLKDEGKEVETQGGTLDDDDEESTVSQASRVKRMAQGTKNRLSGVFKRGKKKNNDPPTPIKEEPPKQVLVDAPQDNLLPAMSSDSADCVEPVTKVPAHEETPEPEKELVDKEVAVYEDDNTGTKEEQFCSGCAIL